MIAAPIDLLCLDSSRGIGGAEVSIERILTRLDPARIRPTLACPAMGALGMRLSERGVAVLPWVPASRSQPLRTWDPLHGGVLRRLILPFASAASVARLGSWISARSNVVIHANTFQAAVLGAALSTMTGRPFVFHSRILKKHGALERWVCRRARRVLVPSQAGAAKWGDLFAGKTQVLIDGIDRDVFHPTGDRSLRRVHGAAESDIVVVSISRVTHEKKLEHLIEAASYLSRDILLWIAGEPFLPEDKKYLLDLQSMAGRLGVRARFLGFVSDVPRLIEAGDIFVLPTPREMFGQVLLEAMSMGRPAVAVAAFGPAEIVEDGVTGLLFEPNDTADLARKIAELAGNPDRRAAMGAAARRAVSERYCLERTISEFEAIIDAVATEHRS